jgi:hypothetical protein
MVEIGFGLYFLTLFVIYVVMTIKESNANKYNSTKIQDLKISKKKLVENVLQWCETNHCIPKYRGKLSFKINYYNHTKVEGCYCGYTRTIILYLKNEKKVIDVIDTILHEYQHHIDMRTQKEVKLYFKQLNDFGYENHPMEIAARDFARQHRDTCFETFKNNWL